MTGPNELLYWLSANGYGSWGKFRTAVDALLEGIPDADPVEVRIPLHQRIRLNLQQLGHVEFGAQTKNRGWRVAPPVLAVNEGIGQAAAALCGARVPALVSALCEKRSGVEVQRHGLDEAPELIRFVAKDSQRLQELACQNNINFQPAVSSAMLRCLPRINDLAAWQCQSAEIPFGRDTKIQQFKLSRWFCGWSDFLTREVKARDGAYRITRFQRREHYLRLNGVTYRAPGQFGNYYIAAQRGRRLLRYDRIRRQVQVVDTCRPPLLVDRALILCTGLLPVHDPVGRTLTYSDVPESIAGLAAYVLCQERL